MPAWSGAAPATPACGHSCRRRAGCSRAWRSEIGRDQCCDPAARQAEPILCQPGRAQHQPRQHAGTAAGGALAAQEPGDPRSDEINAATLPRVRLNQSYASLVGRSTSHASMRAQLQEARWLLKSLEIRNDTLTKVARSIVERQSEFLDQGEEYMRPMILRDIAEAIGMHESTVSRVTSGKYMHTPRGVFELRYFFSSQVEGNNGSGTSSTAIRAKIRKLIREEDSSAPLSDSRIAEILSGEGIPVARRTVAKYRETMGLAPSNERRRVNGK